MSLLKKTTFYSNSKQYQKDLKNHKKQVEEKEKQNKIKIEILKSELPKKIQYWKEQREIIRNEYHSIPRNFTMEQSQKNLFNRIVLDEKQFLIDKLERKEIEDKNIYSTIEYIERWIKYSLNDLKIFKENYMNIDNNDLSM